MWPSQHGPAVFTQLTSAHVLSLKKTHMSTKMEEDVKRWMAKRKAALVMEIMQGKTTVAEASRSFDLVPSEIDTRVVIPPIDQRSQK
jgi:hypothetical protein